MYTDPSIISGLKTPTFMNPADMMGMQNAMYKNQLAQLQMAEVVKNKQGMNALAKMYQGGQVDPNTGLPNRDALNAFTGQYPELGMELQNQLSQRQSHELQRKHAQAEIDKLERDAKTQQAKKVAGALLPLARGIMNDWESGLNDKNKNPNDVIDASQKSWIEGIDNLVKNGTLSEDDAKRAKMQSFNPREFRNFIDTTSASINPKTLNPFTNLNPKDYSPESLKKYQQTGDVSDLKPAKKDTRASQEWSDPYPMQGAMVQKNTSTGEIRTAVSRVPASIINLSTGGSNQPEQLSPEGKESASMRYLMFGTMPQVGWGDKKTRQQIINQAAEAGKKLGLSPMEQAILPQDNKVKMKAVGNLVNWGAGLKKSQQTLEQSLDLAISYAEKVTPSDIKRINQAVIAGKKEFGSGPAAGYGLAMMTVEREYGRLMMGPLSNAMMPVEAIKSTHGLMSTADSLDALREMRSVMRKDAQYVIDGVDSQVGALRGSIQNMGKDSPSTGSTGKNVNAKGWKLHTDAKGNKAYVSPDGKQFEEVK